MASIHVASKLVKAITNIIYPVGSIYISTNTANPSSYLGGTWTQVAKEAYLIGYNASNTWFNQPGQNKGSANGPGSWNTNNHNLTINEIPSHRHDVLTVWGQAEGYGHVNVGSTSGANKTDIRGLGTYVGGGQGHNHFHVSPYYIVVVWKRTA